MIIKRDVTRRRVLRGTIGGAAISVGLPFLNYFLNDNGTALANSGGPLPVIFGNWVRGLGFTPGFWEPEVIGPGYQMTKHMDALTPYKDKINIFSGMKVFLDGKPSLPHGTGPQVIHGGTVGTAEPSLDQLIAEVIGRSTRFRSIEACSDGTPTSQSRRGGSVSNPSETSPVALYTRIFGPEFTDPNAADFTPDPEIIIRRSALSAVSEERQGFVRSLGAEDRARADEYFTSLRELENQLEVALQKPAPLEACTKPESPDDAAKGGLIVEDAEATHKLFARLLAHALACGQTRVFSMQFDSTLSNLRLAGDAMTHHMYTHEEQINAELGYQKQVMWFSEFGIRNFALMLSELEAIKEGDGTLLDRSAVFFSTDHGFARMHSLENIPLMIAGGAGGRLKTGMHIAARGDTVTRVGLTLQQAMGVPVSKWGKQSNESTNAFTEILA